MLFDLGQAEISCSIYARRPTPCRAFASWLEDGSPNPQCQQLRAGIGLAPLPGLAEVFEAC